MKLAVMGATGRMGQALINDILSRDDLTLAGGIETPGHPDLGRDLGRLVGRDDIGVELTSDALEVIARVDGIIDFTGPQASVEFAGLAAQARIVHVLGTTGLSAENVDKIKAAARHAVIIQSGNMSLGVNLLKALTEKVAAALGTDWDIEIAEMHHRHKVDAPSGTALLLGEAAAKGRGTTLQEAAVRGRDGITGERGAGDIGFASLRGGSVVGDHSVIFAGDSERITLSHIAEDRRIFVRGALAAALWGHGKRPGFYSMADVLGL
ncbi:MAG: 4-hydroxy-tetrahydrodipicolinate reductase [Alphaproteobacteria bacterium]|nr:MAG: 4-hydroxy-tetrahydrodipicolinate reductase [Alphaproteobacteria bacterium]